MGCAGGCRTACAELEERVELAREEDEEESVFRRVAGPEEGDVIAREEVEGDLAFRPFEPMTRIGGSRA